MEKKIGFNDLTTALKILVVIMWVIASVWALAFLIGFASVFLESSI